MQVLLPLTHITYGNDMATHNVIHAHNVTRRNCNVNANEYAIDC